MILGEAIVIGDGPSASLILDNPELADGCTVCLVNRVGYKWGHPAKYWFTLHPGLMEEWWRVRDYLGFPDIEAIVHGPHDMPNDRPYRNIMEPHRAASHRTGSSSMFGALVLLEMGYSPINLYGVDLTDRYYKFRRGWARYKREPLIFHGDNWFKNKEWL